MRRWKWAIGTLAAAVAVAMLSTGIGLAEKGGKGGGQGGGAGSNGGGVIYFYYGAGLYTMQDDGSGIAPVLLPEGFGPGGDPSHQLHAGKRWFVQTQWVPGEFYPDFVCPDGTRKDANRLVFVALSDGGDDAVELTIPSDVEPLGAMWTVDDGYVSWPGRRWDIDPDSPTYATVLECGLYATEIIFDGAGNVSGAAGSELIFPMSLVSSPEHFIPGPDMVYFDWAPDGLQFVFDAVSRDELRIGNVVTAQFHVILADPDQDISKPLWSPAGDKIMFNYFTGWNQATSINPDGSGLKKLIGSSPTWTRSVGVWSPTGSHLLFQHFDHFLDDSHIIRANANGSSPTRLTGPEFGDFAGPRAIGWR